MRTNGVGRVVGIILAAATLMASCQCAAAPPAPSAAAMRPYAGTWYAPTSGMTISSKGRVSVEMKDMSTSPFDYLAFDMQAYQASSKQLKAKVVKSDSRRVPVGSIYTFSPTSKGLKMSGPVSKEWCTRAGDQQAKCGGWGWG